MASVAPGRAGAQAGGTHTGIEKAVSRSTLAGSVRVTPLLTPSLPSPAASITTSDAVSTV